MPDNTPTAAQVWQGDVTFFSIDTDLLQGAGFHFSQGALHQLPRQLPASMGMQLTEVVVEEVVNHRMRPVTEAIQQLMGASDKLKRLAITDLTQVDHTFAALDVATTATHKFRKEVHDYAELCRGGVLPIAGANAAGDLFEAYFAGKPPFALRRDKKSEFPDAMSLWLLEKYAEDNVTMGIVASGDEGWKNYAAKSDRLYYVKSIDELATLFAATTGHANAIKAKIEAAVSDPNSALRAELQDALNLHVGKADWDTSDIYSGYMRIEADAYDADVEEYVIRGDLNIWPVEGEPTTWVIELTATVTVNVHINVEFFAWDSIDREEIGMGSEDASTQEEIEVEAFLSCADVQLDTAPDDWSIEIEIARGRYRVQPFEVERDFSDD